MRLFSTTILAARNLTVALMAMLMSSGASAGERRSDAAADIFDTEHVGLADGLTQRSIDDTGSPTIFAPALGRAFQQSETRERAEILGDSTPSPPLEINIVLHVLSGPGAYGDVSDEVIAEQLSVLNEAFRTTRFHFNLADIRRYPNSPYFSGGCFPTTEMGQQMKRELAIAPEHFVNVYSCRLALPYIVGYGSLPNEYPESDPRHGIVIDFGTFPGSAPPLSLGHTLVHELGHYFGLLHPFQGGCADPGDDVSDTPAEAVPAFGCMVGRDSCPADGLDAVDNFMDYSDDTCTDNFSPLQSARMQALTAAYRPHLGEPIRSESLPTMSSIGLLALALALLVSSRRFLNKELLRRDGASVP